MNSSLCKPSKNLLSEEYREIFLSSIEITPYIIRVCGNSISQALIISLRKAEQKALNENILACFDTLENIVLEADPCNYKIFKSELEDILKKRTNSHFQDIIAYCDKMIELLHLSSNTPSLLLNEVKKTCEGLLASLFPTWGLPSDPQKLEDEHRNKIPWNRIFESVSSEMRNHVLSLLQSHQRNFVMLRRNIAHPEDDVEVLEKKASSLKNLREKIKNQQIQDGSKTEEDIFVKSKENDLGIDYSNGSDVENIDWAKHFGVDH